MKTERRRPLRNSLSFSKSVRKVDIRLPALPGCVSEGHTYEEALQNIKEAIEGYLEATEKQARMTLSPTTVQYAKVAM